MSETIAAAAWKDPRDGTVYTGDMHYDCYCRAADAEKSRTVGVPFTYESPSLWVERVAREISVRVFRAGEGFVTSEGRFVDRMAALKIANAARQAAVDEDARALMSEQINDYEGSVK